MLLTVAIQTLMVVTDGLGWGAAAEVTFLRKITQSKEFGMMLD